MPPKGRDLEREVFGGSESELSSDEDEELLQPPRPPQPALQHPPPTVHDDHESSAGGRSDSEDDYVQQQPPQQRPSSTVVGKATKKKVRKKRAQAQEIVEGGEPSKKSKKRKRRQPVEIDLSGLPPEQANKLRLDMKIDEILKSKKNNRPRKKKTDSEVLDSFADDEVARLRESMNNVADEDVRSNQEKMPALAKLKMLGEAMETLRKASLAQSIIDNNLLEAVRRWLEPLPDRSLPALTIQRELFLIIRKMEFIDSSVLKESGLGRIVLFYTKCKRVTPDVARIANELVEFWSRPIIKRSASYRDRIIPVALDPASSGGGGGRAAIDMRAGEKLSSILARAKEEENRPGARRIKKNAVSIPQRELGTYVVAPMDNMGLGVGGRVSASVEIDVERRRKNAERLRSLTRKVGVGK